MTEHHVRPKRQIADFTGTITESKTTADCACGWRGPIDDVITIAGRDPMCSRDQIGRPWEPTGARLARWRRWGLEICAGAAWRMTKKEYEDLPLLTLQSYMDRFRVVTGPMAFPHITEAWRCHDLVSCWLENHPTEAATYDPGGFGYLQVLTIAEREHSTSLKHSP